MRSRRPPAPPPGSFECLLTELEVGCPSCAAPLRIADGDATAACGFCGRGFFLTGAGRAAQTYIAPRLGDDEARRSGRSWLRAGGHRATHVGAGRWVLAPYWRFRAKAFKWFVASRATRGRSTADDDRDTFRDLLVRSFEFTLPASRFDAGVMSLNTRAELLVTHVPDARARAWARIEPVTVSFEQARITARQRVDRWTRPPGGALLAEKLALLDEGLSVVYFPFFVLDYQFRERIGRVIVDGRSGAVTAHVDAAEEPRAAPGGAPGAGAGTVESMAGRSERRNLGAGAGGTGGAPGAGGTGGAGGADEADRAISCSDHRDLGVTAFVPLRCPTCSTDLPPARADRVHACPGCQRAWEIRDGAAVREIRQRLIDNGIPIRDGHWTACGRLLPFWGVEVVARGWQLGPPLAERSGPDGARAPARASDHALAPGPAAISDPISARDQRLTVYVPAFDGRHVERLCQLGIHLTRARPRFADHATWPVRPSGCSLGRADAERMAWVMLGAMASPDAGAFERFLARGAVDIAAVELLWIPFRAAGLYLREPGTGALVREVSTRPWDDEALLAA